MDGARRVSDRWRLWKGVEAASNAILEIFRIPRENGDLMRSQLTAFSRQVPLLYVILVVNTCALAWTHYGVAPLGRTLVFPTLLAIACGIRMWMWMTRTVENLSDEALARHLRATIAVTNVFGVTFLAWSLSLYPYGDAYAQEHIAFFIGITVVGCIFCLMHLRPAALMLTIVVVIPFSIFFIASGNSVFIAIALNMLLVSAAMIYILLSYSRDFANMITFQRDLIKSHQIETEKAGLFSSLY